MITRRIFTFPIATLYTEADLILTAAESAAEQPLIDARLADGHVAATRGIRAKYRLDLFPPNDPETKDPAPAPTPPVS